MAVLVEAGEARCRGLAPVGEALGRLLLEGRELGMAENGGLHRGERRLQPGVAGPVPGLEENAAHAGEHLPVRAERVQITLRDATAQVAVDVLPVLGLGAVDVAWQAEVVVVLRVADFCNRHHAGVP